MRILKHVRKAKLYYELLIDCNFIIYNRESIPPLLAAKAKGKPRPNTLLRRAPFASAISRADPYTISNNEDLSEKN